MPVRKPAIVVLLAGTIGVSRGPLVPAVRPQILWRNPADIASRNLFYGPGGKDHQPRPPFRFVKEDLDGTNPKFVIRDREGRRAPKVCANPSAQSIKIARKIKQV